MNDLLSDAPRPCDLGLRGMFTEHRTECTGPPTHRYRAKSIPDETWGYRCAGHVGMLDQDYCLIEALAAVQ